METTAKYISVGRKDCRERLQDSVCISTSAFQRRGLHFRETGTSWFIDTGVASSAVQGGHRTCSPARQRVRLLRKKDGGLRPILDLRGLNRYLRSYKFKMLTIKMIVSPIQSGDWFVTIYLKDAYFHVEILPQHRKFLRFAFGSLPVSGSSIQPSFVTPHVYEMHGCSTGSSATPGHSHFKLHKRLDDSGHSLKSLDIEMST